MSASSGRRPGWGILATGGIARHFTADLLADGHRVAAVGSRSASSARAFAQEFAIPAAHGSYAALVADPEVDVVYVATPHPFHTEHALLALAAGKHVLVEKPFALNAADADRIVRAADDRGLLVLEAMWTRFLPHLARVRELLAAGAIGEVSAFTADLTLVAPAAPGHRLTDLALGGGSLLDLGVYPVSIAIDLFGAPELVLAAADFAGSGVDARVAMTLRHPGGVLSSLFCAIDARGRNVATILGRDGRIEIDRWWHTPTTVRVYDARQEVVETFDTPVAGHGRQFQAREVERLLAGGLRSSELMTAHDSLVVMRTLDAIRAQIGLSYPGEPGPVGGGDG